MQDWVLKRGTKIVCQIALKRRIQHIHSSHFLVFQISNGCSLWKVASANMQYLLFKGIWHWFFFFSIFKTLKALEIQPSSHKAAALSIVKWGAGGGGGGWKCHPPRWGRGVGPQVCRWLLALHKGMPHGCTVLPRLRAPHGPPRLPRGGYAPVEMEKKNVIGSYWGAK